MSLSDAELQAKAQEIYGIARAGNLNKHHLRLISQAIENGVSAEQLRARAAQYNDIALALEGSEGLPEPELRARLSMAGMSPAEIDSLVRAKANAQDLSPRDFMQGLSSGKAMPPSELALEIKKVADEVRYLKDLKTTKEEELAIAQRIPELAKKAGITDDDLRAISVNGKVDREAFFKLFENKARQHEIEHGFKTGALPPDMSKADMQKLMMDRSLELKKLEYKRQAQHKKLANQYGGLMQYKSGGGLNLLQPTSGLEQLIEIGRVLQNVSPQTYQEFNALLKHEPNIFMFSPKVMDTLIADLNSPEAAIPAILDLPFRTCLIEAYSFDPETRQSILCSVPAKGTDVGDFGMKIERAPIDDADLILSVPTLFIHETTVGQYELAGFVHVLDKQVKDAYTVFPFLASLQNGFFVNFRPRDGAVADPTFASFAMEAMRRLVHRITNLQGYQSGTARAAIRAKIKSGGQTYFHKIKQVIYLGLKQEQHSKRSVAGEAVDWSHRWEVRGHWRKITGIGKDREGKAGVRGFTWVVPHVKGSEDLPLIKKIRADMPARGEINESTESI